jgi:chemotaxis protein methyltransferase CheR
VLIEQGELDEAVRSLQRAVYLRQDFILAHFTLGNLARRRGGTAEAERHFTNTLRLLDACHFEDVLPESDGLTAGRLTATIHAMLGLRAVARAHR